MSDFLEETKREIKARIEELRPFVGEVAQLEQALAALDGTGSAPARRGRAAARPRRTKAVKPGTSRRGAARGETKGLILDHVKAHPGSTAGDVAGALSLNRNSVATRMAQLAKAGVLAKAERGYTVA